MLQTRCKRTHTIQHTPSRRRTALCGRSPAHQAISNIIDIARGRRDAIIQVGVVGGARIEEARSDIDSLGMRIRRMGPGLGHELFEARAGRSARDAVVNHLRDFAGRAGRHVGARAAAIVRLHQAWIDDAVVGGGHVHAAFGFLHDRGQNKSLVDFGRLRDLADRGL